jgi:hypothetical protein
MELIILSLVGSLGTVLLHLLEVITYPSGHAPSAVTHRAVASRQWLQDQRRATASARYAEDLLADRRPPARSLRAG